MAQRTVELFGSARLLAGAAEIRVDVSEGATAREVISAVARSCPPLVGPVLRVDPPALGEGYLISLGGRGFVGELDRPLDSEEPLLLLPAAAGGSVALTPPHAKT